MEFTKVPGNCLNYFMPKVGCDGSFALCSCKALILICCQSVVLELTVYEVAIDFHICNRTLFRGSN